MTRLLLVIGAAAVITALPRLAVQAQRPQFRDAVEAVRLDVLVTDRGRPLLGLSAQDFEVRDNGVVQTLDTIGVDTIPLNLILTLDTSDSVSGAALDRLREASGSVLDGLRQGDRAALLTFGDSLSLRSPLTSDYTRIHQGLLGTAGKGRTALIDASYASLWLSEGDPGRALAIVFSDGNDTASWLGADRVIEGARRADLVVYGVTTGRISERDFLGALSVETGGRLFTVDPSSTLRRTFAAILEEFRQRYIISYTARGVAIGGWHKIDVRVKGRSNRVIVRSGYLGGPS